MDTTQRKPKHKILNPFPLERDDDINDPLAIQKRSKISCNSALSCCHDPLLSDSERDFCTHNLMIADWERGPFTSLKKKCISLLLFPAIPSAPPPPALSLRPIKSKPCILLFSHSQSELMVQPSVFIWWGWGVGERGGEGWGADIKRWWGTKYWGSHDTHKQAHFYFQTNP